MSRYFGEYEDCFISEPLAKDVKRTGGDFEVDGNAGHDGYTVYNQRLRMMTAGDWPEDIEESKSMDKMFSGSGILRIGY